MCDRSRSQQTDSAPASTDAAGAEHCSTSAEQHEGCAPQQQQQQERQQQADVLPARNADYLQPAYWDARFRQEEHFEWFGSYRHAGYSRYRFHLKPHLQPGDHILVLGCGSSRLPQELAADGFAHVTAVDISPVIIERMRSDAMQRGCSSITWQVADMLNLPFQDGSFNAVIEKGTLDVLVTDSSSPWDPAPAVQQRMHAALAEAHRVLHPGGVLLSITFAQPHFRRPHLLASSFDWSCKWAVAAEGSAAISYFCYALQRGQRRAQEDAPLSFGVLPGCNAAAHSLPGGSTLHEHMDQEDFLLRCEL